jgi:hypothetical protein
MERNSWTKLDLFGGLDKADADAKRTQRTEGKDGWIHGEHGLHWGVDIYDQRWNENFDRQKAFIRRRMVIPNVSESGASQGRLQGSHVGCAASATLARRGTLLPERRTKLDTIGFSLSKINVSERQSLMMQGKEKIVSDNEEAAAAEHEIAENKSSELKCHDREGGCMLCP